MWKAMHSSERPNNATATSGQQCFRKNNEVNAIISQRKDGVLSAALSCKPICPYWTSKSAKSSFLAKVTPTGGRSAFVGTIFSRGFINFSCSRKYLQQWDGVLWDWVKIKYSGAHWWVFNSFWTQPGLFPTCSHSSDTAAWSVAIKASNFSRQCLNLQGFTC